MTAKAKTYKFPKTIGACADRLYALREERTAAQRVADLLEEEEKALKEHIINVLPKSEASGVSGRVAKVAITTAVVPQVKDWEAFYAFLKKTKRFEFMQRRVADGPIKEMWEAGKVVPGVEPFTVVKVSLTKVT